MRAAQQTGQQAVPAAQQFRPASGAAAPAGTSGAASAATPQQQLAQQGQKAAPAREADPTDVLAGTGIDMEAEAAALTANLGAGGGGGSVGASAAASSPAAHADAPLFGQVRCCVVRTAGLAVPWWSGLLWRDRDRHPSVDVCMQTLELLGTVARMSFGIHIGGPRALVGVCCQPAV